ncbi:MAG TPA: deaminase [Acidimicrobiales bacterium]|nr:deaminase [Acidimicrobiales bacterium]
MTRPQPGPDDDRRWLRLAVDLAHLCPPSESAFSVGSVIVSDSEEIARGYSRETDINVHAEEAALAKLDPADPRLTRATIYSSLEPCSARRSRPRTCTQLILSARIPRVVFAWREPALFVDAHGLEELRSAGVEVIEIPDLAEAARSANTHLRLSEAEDRR